MKNFAFFLPLVSAFVICPNAGFPAVNAGGANVTTTDITGKLAAAIRDIGAYDGGGGTGNFGGAEVVTVKPGIFIKE